MKRSHDELPRHVLDGLLEGCQVVRSDDCRYLYVNDAAATHGRTTKEQLLGRTMMEAYPGIEHTEMFAVLRRCIDDRSPQQMENAFTYEDGSKGWFELRFEPVPEGVVILSLDVTARKRAEAVARRAMRGLTVLSECNQTLVRAVDERQLMQDVCRIAVERGGYRLAWIGMKGDDAERSIRRVALAGRDDGDVERARLTWSDTERGGGPTGRAIRTGSSQQARFILTDRQLEPWREDAFERGFGSSIALPIDVEGECVGALMLYAAEEDAFDDEEKQLLDELALDLGYGIETLRARTARTQAEAQARVLTERIRAIYDHLPHAVLAWLRQGEHFVLADANEVARTKGAVASFVGRPARELVGTFPEIEQDLARCFESRAPVRREVECCLPGATSLRQLVLSYEFIPTGMVVLHSEDVTEQRRIEEQLMVSQRLEAVGRLAGGVAHDFNNLLSVIIGYANVAIEELRESDPLHADIVEIREAGQRAAALTRQLLAFSRKQVLEPRVLDLNAVIGGIEAMLRRMLGEDIEIVVRVAGDLGRIEADPGQIEQVVMNLAVNARDAMPGGGRLIVETANVDLDEGYADRRVAVEPGRYVLLSVTDTGQGMDAATREQIFEPFFTTKEKGKGTGLGLSTVYGIVKQSGGHIWVYSEPGQGTTFKIYLPRVDAPFTETEPRPPSVMASGSRTVLVVEDEDAVRKLAERILRRAGYEVLTAANGGEALLLCEKHGGEIGLLLTDVVMPLMSGRELAERLAMSWPKLKTLYMSGYTDDAIVDHGVLDAGARFIGKPFSAAELTRSVYDALADDPA